MVCLDGLGSLPALSGYSMVVLRKLKADALLKLQEMVPMSPEASSSHTPNYDTDHFVQLGSFAIPKGHRKPSPHMYDIQAPTTRDNAMRLVRASQLSKPILVDGGHPGEFAWKEADFLKAMQDGHWVLLDEMNLAPQSVLYGLY